MKKEKKVRIEEKQISHINNDWCWTYEAKDGTIAVEKLKWWERILYLKFPDKSYKF